VTHVNYTPPNVHGPLPQQNENIRTIQERTTTWKSRTLHGRKVHDLEKSDVDKTASNAWPKFGELFSETTGFVIATRDQVISTNNYK
jgi:hypothetical protein